MWSHKTAQAGACQLYRGISAHERWQDSRGSSHRPPACRHKRDSKIEHSLTQQGVTKQRNSPALGPGRVRHAGQSWYLVPVLIIGGAPGAPARGNRGARSWQPPLVAPGKPLPQAPIFQHHFGSISGTFSTPSWPPKSAPNRSKTSHKIHLKFHCFLVLVFSPSHTPLAAMLQASKSHF